MGHMAKEKQTDEERAGKVHKSFWVESDLIQRLQALADADERSLAFMVNKAIRTYVEQNEPRKAGK